MRESVQQIVGQSQFIETRSLVRPEVDIRIAALTVSDGHLLLLAEPIAVGLRLPRSGPVPSESIDESARATIRDHLGFPEQYLEQLYTLSIDDSGTWRVVVSYVALISSIGAPRDPATGAWMDVPGVTGLDAGDDLVLEYALFRIRGKLDYTTIGFHLLPTEFTLSELQATYETVLNRKLDKRNFRRRMTSLSILSVTGSTRRDGSHRPARVYRFSPDRDSSDYLTPLWAAAREGT